MRTKLSRACCVPKRTRVASMRAVDVVFQTLERHLHFRIDPGAESHRQMRAACVDAVTDVLDGKVE